MIAALAACTTYQRFDSTANLEQSLAGLVDPELRARVVVPYEISDSVLQSTAGKVNPAWGEQRRTDAIIDFIFADLDLEYTLAPTLDANAAFELRRGNCLSFVNLFVGIARHNRLNPFYVEVQDYHRWNYQRGVVVSQGHIVAGMYVDGQLSTFDFLPYAPKAYRNFKPIDDLRAMAHYYNNLGAEALMAERDADAYDDLQIAVALAPTFDKAVNNLGVALLRRGEVDRAIELLADARERFPDNVPIISNLARAHQERGDVTEAGELFDRLETLDQTSPFFFVYRGDLALANGDQQKALDYMRRAFQSDSELPEVHLGLVRVYLALGRTAEARHHVERALKLDATNEEARKYAAMLTRGAPGG